MKTKSIYLIAFSLLILCCKNKNQAEEISAPTQIPIHSELGNEQKNKVDVANATTVSFKETDFVYGSIPKNTKVHHYFTFQNTGNNPLTISSVNPSCGCTVPKFPTKPILPGQKDSIMLEFNSENFTGEIHKSATVIANVVEPIILKFSGNIAN